MSVTKTNNLEITYLAANQTNKEILVNEGFLKIDCLLNNGAVSRDVATPPESPNDGDMYIIPTSATDDWSGEDNKFTYYDSSKGWVILTANEGMTLWVNDEDKLYTYDGANWVTSGEFDDLGELGINANADGTNRLAVKSDAVLFDNDGDDSQVKVNKNSSGDTASHLFQANYSGRAEFGLTGDNNFHIKVSSNGADWNESIKIFNDNSKTDITPQTNFSNGISFDDGTNVLSNYETGVWTPVLRGVSTVGTNSYQTQDGNYTKIGNIVMIDAEIRLDGTSGALDSTGKLELIGLPFTPSQTNSGCNIGLYQGFNMSSGENLMMHVSAQGEIRLKYANNIEVDDITDSKATDDLRIRFSSVYFV